MSFLSTRWLTTKVCTIRRRTIVQISFGWRPCFFWRAFFSICVAWWCILRRSEGPCLAPRLLFLLDNLARDWGDVVVVLLELSWFLRRFHVSSSTAVAFTGFPVGIALRTLLFGRIFAKFEDLDVVHVGDQILRLRLPSAHSKAATTCKEDLSGEVQDERRESQQNRRMTLKPVPTSGPSKVTSSIVTMNLEFNSTCRRKKHSPFNWNTLMSQGLLIMIWMWYKRNELTISGMSIPADIYQNRAERGCTKFTLLKREASQRIHVVREETDKDSNDQIMHGQERGRKLVKPLRIEKKQERAKEKPNLTMLENSEEFTLLIQMTENIQNFSKTQEENWKERMVHPSVTKVTQSNGNKKEFKTMYGCTVESHESTRQRAEPLQSQNSWRSHCKKRSYFFDTLQFGAQICSGTTSDEDSGCKSCREQGMEKTRHCPSAEFGRKVKSKKGQRDKNKVHFATLMDMCHLKNAELEPKLQKYKDRVVLWRGHCKIRLWSARIFSMNRARLRPRWLPQQSWVSVQDYQVVTHKLLVQYLLVLG